MKIFDFISYEEMSDYIEKADLIITHSGTGSVLTPLKLGKKVIVCSRLKKFGEHVDDHQQELTEVLKKENYIFELTEDNSLDQLYKEIKDFKPKKYQSNTNNFIKKLKAEIENDIMK
jgi:UDP-N-acetylglucosamine transferase subunit ALG13